MSLVDAYSYRVELDWRERRGGVVHAQGLPELVFSAPPEFGGIVGRWTPEHLLVAANASCFMASLLAVADAQKLSLAYFRLSSVARMERVPGEGYRITEIVLRPEIGVAEEDMPKLEKVLAKAEKICIVGNALNVRVQVEPKIEAQAMAMTP